MTTSSGGTAVAPSSLPLNVTSLIRLAFGMAAGALGLSASANSSTGQAILALIIGIVAVLWVVFKNNAHVATLEDALTSPAMTLVTPAGVVKATPNLPLILLGLLLVGAAPGLVACGQQQLIPAGDTVAVATGETVLDRSLNEALKYYLANASTYSADKKATLRPLIAKAGALVQACDAAEILGNESTMTAQIADAVTLIGQIKTALGMPS